MDLSVIICCYNSEKLITETLKHILQQKTPEKFNFEVILVDNNSKDNTTKVAKQLWGNASSKAQLKLVKERTPGLAHARKKGVANSTAAFLLFCDDDNLLDENYIFLSYSFLIKNKHVGAVGGQSKGVLEGNIPNWWHQEAHNYAVGQQSTISGDVSKRGFLWGAGLVIRKSILENLYAAGFSSLLLGRTGEKITSGDDSELCKWILIANYKLWYLDSLHFKHYITKERLTETYRIKIKKGQEASLVILDDYDWFIKNINRYDQKRIFLQKGKDVIKLIIRGITDKDRKWKEKLQLIVGSKFKIHAHLYKIYTIYKKLERNRI